jgi:hypothetical protein
MILVRSHVTRGKRYYYITERKEGIKQRREDVVSAATLSRMRPAQLHAAQQPSSTPLTGGFEGRPANANSQYCSTTTTVHWAVAGRRNGPAMDKHILLPPLRACPLPGNRSLKPLFKLQLEMLPCGLSCQSASSDLRDAASCACPSTVLCTPRPPLLCLLPAHTQPPLHIAIPPGGAFLQTSKCPGSSISN